MQAARESLFGRLKTFASALTCRGQKSMTNLQQIEVIKSQADFHACFASAKDSTLLLRPWRVSSPTSAARRLAGGFFLPYRKLATAATMRASISLKP
jgi:hypothetical protein